MKERPIIFSTEMVKAILEGRKIQTRRVIKQRPLPVVDYENRCPYGQVGDRLWVRESWTKDIYTGQVLCYKADEILENIRWISPFFMPRHASRILLEITEVRVERLQEILFTDIIKEGINPQEKLPSQVKAEFASLWDSLNAKRGYSWETNPWIWCLTFRRKEVMKSSKNNHS